MPSEVLPSLSLLLLVFESYSNNYEQLPTAEGHYLNCFVQKTCAICKLAAGVFLPGQRCLAATPADVQMPANSKILSYASVPLHPALALTPGTNPRPW